MSRSPTLPPPSPPPTGPLVASSGLPLSSPCEPEPRPSPALSSRLAESRGGLGGLCPVHLPPGTGPSTHLAPRPPLLSQPSAPTPRATLPGKLVLQRAVSSVYCGADHMASDAPSRPSEVWCPVALTAGSGPLGRLRLAKGKPCPHQTATRPTPPRPAPGTALPSVSTACLLGTLLRVGTQLSGCVWLVRSAPCPRGPSTLQQAPGRPSFVRMSRVPFGGRTTVLCPFICTGTGRPHLTTEKSQAVGLGGRASLQDPTSNFVDGSPQVASLG